MGDGLAHGEHHLVVVELPLEEERQGLEGGDRLRAAFEQALEALGMVLVQVGDARGQAVEDALADTGIEVLEIPLSPGRLWQLVDAAKDKR